MKRSEKMMAAAAVYALLANASAQSGDLLPTNIISIAAAALFVAVSLWTSDE